MINNVRFFEYSSSDGSENAMSKVSIVQNAIRSHVMIIKDTSWKNFRFLTKSIK